MVGDQFFIKHIQDIWFRVENTFAFPAHKMNMGKMIHGCVYFLDFAKVFSPGKSFLAEHIQGSVDRCNVDSTRTNLKFFEYFLSR